tara:strand:- start:440 stop:1672 length:1233 start_codon:yes stop_codon:yes gene_type:complete
MSTILINTSQSTVAESVDILVPGAGDIQTIKLPNEDVQPKLASNGVIDVVNNFSWYAGPKASAAVLNKVPCVFLTEREQKISSLISGAMYYLKAAGKAIQGQAENAGFGDAGDPTSLLGKLNAIGSDGGPISQIKGTVGKIRDAIADYAKEDTALLGAHNLKSLEGIYLTTKTGFEYRLPFYDTDQSVSSEWGEQSEGTGGVLGGIISKGMQMADTVSQTLNITQPGVYIEKPKYFQNAEAGQTRTVKFPLLNTIRRAEVNQVQQNYELLWLLAFQNKAYKTSFAKTPPPKIYTISVPGQFSMPYAYISNLSINFLGTVRRLPVSTPTLSNKAVSTTSVEVPIPEAYEVTIEFTSLIGDYGNTMMSNAFTTHITNDTVIRGSAPTPEPPTFRESTPGTDPFTAGVSGGLS